VVPPEELLRDRVAAALAGEEEEESEFPTAEEMESVAATTRLGRTPYCDFAIFSPTRRSAVPEEVLDILSSDSSEGAESSAEEKTTKRAGLPKLPVGRKRGSKTRALAIFDDEQEERRALWELQSGFHAPSGAPSLNSKRATVEELAVRAMRLPADTTAAEARLLIYPLTTHLVQQVAAALKRGDYRGAEQYLGELRIAHIESGAEVSAVLARTFDNCRRSVNRGLGPPQRAGELRLEEVRVEDEGYSSGDEESEDEDKDETSLANPGRSYVVSEGWLLREIEQANAETGHCGFSREPGMSQPEDNSSEEEPSSDEEDPPPLVSESSDDEAPARKKGGKLLDLVAELRLPVSKTDLRGTGASRKLRCNCRRVGRSRCAPHMLRRQVRQRLVEQGADPRDPTSWSPEILSSPLFPDRRGRVPSKKKVIEGWQRCAPPNQERISGHSARRSGAKRRAREGWLLNVIMLLGRWAGTSVMAYVEEALAELAISGDGSRGSSSSSSSSSSRKKRERKQEEDEDNWTDALPAMEQRIKELEEKLNELRARQGADRNRLADLEQDTATRHGQPTESPYQSRWLKGTRPGGKLHREASHSSVKTPAWMWTTGCGWKFGSSQHYEWVKEEDLDAELRTTRPCDAGCDVHR